MTTAEALQSIQASAPYRNAGGDMAVAIAKWKASNEGEYVKWLAFLNDRIAGRPSSPPALTTLFGKGVVALVVNGTPAVDPPPPTPPEMFDYAGLIVAPGELSGFSPHVTAPPLWEVGFRRVSTTVVEGSADNATVVANLAELPRSKPVLEASGWKVGAFAVFRGPPVEQAKRLGERVGQHALKYAVVDVEWYKADTSAGRVGADLADEVVAAVAASVPVPIAYIGFGDTGGENHLCGATSPTDPKPIVQLVEFVKGGPYIAEGYKGNGEPLDVVRGVRLTIDCVKDASKVKPAIGRYEVAAAAAALRQAHDTYGTVGFEVWDGANLKDGYAELSAAIRAGAARL